MTSPASGEQGPIVRPNDAVMRGIAAEVRAGLAAEPEPLEIGGILLGRIQGRRLMIEDFEPVPCEHKFGPSYELSEEDQRQFRESVEWFVAQQESAGDVVGVYRSHLQSDAALAASDREWIERLLPATEWLLLLVKPAAEGELAAEMLFSSRGVNKVSEATPFPFAAPFGIPLFPEPRERESAPASPESDLAPEPETAAGEPPAPVSAAEEILHRRPVRDLFGLLDPPRRRQEREPQAERPQRGWVWPAAVAAATLVAGLLGYASVDPEPPPPRRTLPVAATQPDVVPPAAETAPAVLPPNSLAVERGVRDALDRWTSTIKTGDVDEIAELYAPRVSRYFSLNDAGTADVRRTVTDSMQRYGRPAILRLSDIKIQTLPDGRATATFHKHWQTRGPSVFAGEEQERLGFTRMSGEWKIDSEEELRVLWLQRPKS